MGEGDEVQGLLDLSSFRGLDRELTVEVSGGRRNFLLVNDNGRHIKLAPGAYFLLKSVHRGRSFAQLAEEYSANTGRPVAAAEIEAAYRRVAARIATIDSAGRQTLPSGFWLRVPLLPETLVARLASRLSTLFQPAVAAALLAFCAATFILLLRHGVGLPQHAAPIWLGYLLFVASLLAHELGHAAACARFGVAPSDIGFTFYLVYPAFYSDVTPAWQLPRGKRVVVDLGGFFFQFVVTAAGAAAYLAWGWEPLKVAFVLTWYSALFALNPVFRFDGYWVLADALGVTDLSRQPARLARHVLALTRRRPPGALPWPPWLVGVLVLYSVASCWIWGLFVWRLAPFLARSTIQFPQELLSLGKSFLAGAPSRVLWDRSGVLVALGLLLATSWFGMGRLLLTALIRPLLVRLSSGRGSLLSRPGLTSPEGHGS